MTKENIDFGFSEDEKEYDIEKFGSYGRFSTKNSYPIEYILTTLRPELLDEYLTFAKDVRPEQIDFDLLMQRDLDEDRVRNEIAPYLDPNSYTSTNSAQSSQPRALFFPPLLVAVAPVTGKDMGSFYEDEVCEINGTGNSRRAYRRWGKLFQVTYQESSSVNAPSIDTYDKNGEHLNFCAKPGQVFFEARKAKGNNKGVRLIVIDGQHRLKALQEIYGRRDGSIDDIMVPVCLLFAPKSQERLRDENSLPVPEVFRQLFVDVNNTAEAVGGHFNILLSDYNIGSLICRRFCSSILSEEEGKQKLATVEWNTKKPKDSTNIVRKYSSTSIGVIEKALRECFKKSPAELEYWLNLSSVQNELYPEGEDKGTLECPIIDWDTFNANQRKVLSKQVDKNAIPFLIKLFFESKPYAFLYNEFKKRLDELYRSSLQDEQKGSSVYLPAYEQIIDYMQIIDNNDRHNRDALRVVRELGDSVSASLETEGLKIIQYALYQRALIAFWFDLLKIGNLFNLDPSIVTDITVSVVNDAHSKKLAGFFDYKNSYMQHSVYRADAIITIEETKKALKNLLGSFLGRDETLDKVKTLIDGKDINEKDFLAKLRDYGERCPEEFQHSYKKGFVRDFKKTYPLDQSLTSYEKDKLSQAEAKQKQHKKEFKQRQRAKEEVTTEFDVLIDEYVKSSVLKASQDLKESLGLSVDIMADHSEYSYDEDVESD